MSPSINQSRQTHLKSQPQSGPDLNLEVVYSLFFRRWKMILFFLLLGIGATTLLAIKKPLQYTSETRVLILFVLETRSVGPSGPNAPRVTTPDGRGENIMSSEMEIVNSSDLATKVAQKIGPEVILAKSHGVKTVAAAAAAISRGLEVENPRKSNIIRVSFTHTDPEVVQRVLTELVGAYRDKHIEIRQNGGPMGSWLRQQRDALATTLGETENALREIQSTNGIISVEESKHTLVQQVSRLTEELRETETQLAEARAMLSGTPTQVGTNTLVFASESLEDYRRLMAEEERLKRQEREALKKYTLAHPEVKRLQGDLAETQQQMEALNGQNPGLAIVAAASVPPSLSTKTVTPGLEIDPSRVPALEAKGVKLKSYLEGANRRIQELVTAELKITQLKRKKDLEEANFRNYQSALDQVEADEAMGLGKVHNIEVVQSPTLPMPESKSRYKVLGIALLLPAFAGLGLAAMLELFLNQKVRRVSDIASKISAPVFMSIPEVRGGSARRVGSQKLLGNVTRVALPAPSGDGGASPSATPQPSAVSFPAMKEDSLGLQVFFERLQDRLTAFFDKIGLTRTPKLVGVTGCQSGSGTTTVVTGLAEALSATGEGNVLVVDMTQDSGTMMHFLSNKPRVDLSDALDSSKRSDARVNKNLYVVAEPGEVDSNEGQIPMVLRKRVMGLIPQLKLSDYDYIIFDLPPMSQTSSAPRLGRFMDLVLLVARGEKTQVGAVKESAELLEEAGATVGVVINRAQNYVPKGLRHGLAD